MMNKKYLTSGMTALALAVLATSCGKETDMYNAGAASEAAKQEFQTSFEQNVTEFDKTHTWNMIGQREATINVGGTAGKTYTLYVCNGNPAVDPDAVLLAQADNVQAGSSCTLSFVAPSASQTVYVVRSDGEQQFVIGAKLNGQKFEGSFAAPTTANAKGMRKSITVGSDIYTRFTYPDTDPFFPTVSELPTCADGTSADYNYWGNNTNFRVDNNATVKPNHWNPGNAKNLYITGGNITLNTDQIREINIYILGGNVRYEGQNEIKGFIAVAQGATLNIVKAKCSDNEDFKIYNRGTVNFPNDSIMLGNHTSIYNEGTVHAKNLGYAPADGTKAFFYNYGENALLTANNMTMNSTGQFFNNGTVRIAGTTHVTQADIYWINDGLYTTNNIVFSAKNKTFYNYCSLIVKSHAHMYDGEFNMMDNSYMEANTAAFDNFIVNMGNNSMFNIKGNTKWEAQGDGTYAGFKSSGDMAYVRLGGTTTVAGHKYSLELRGNVTYAINAINDLGAGNSGVQPTYVLDNQGSVGAPFASAAVSVKTNEQGDTICGATWGSGGGIQPENPVPYSVAFEDLGSIGDFDFNDIVLYVYHYVKTNKATVKLMAAGGTLSVDVKYNGNVIFTKNDGQMTNTTQKGNVIGTVENLTMTNPATDLRNFSIVVKKDNQSSIEITSATQAGKAPMALIIPTEWAWPTERTNIKNAYPEFATWARQNNDTEWYKSPVDGKVIK